MNDAIRILLVEDLPSDAFLVERELRKKLPGYQLVVVDEMTEYLSKLKKFRPDIILSDYSLPGFDWRSAFRIASEHKPRIPFLLVTSTQNPTILGECVQSGIDGLISKNELQQLVPVILDLVGNNPE